MDEANQDRFIACTVAQGLEPVVPAPLAALKNPENRRQRSEEQRMIALKSGSGLAQGQSDITHRSACVADRDSTKRLRGGFSYTVSDEQLTAFARLSSLQRRERLRRGKTIV